MKKMSQLPRKNKPSPNKLNLKPRLKRRKKKLLLKVLLRGPKLKSSSRLKRKRRQKKLKKLKKIKRRKTRKKKKNPRKSKLPLS